MKYNFVIFSYNWDYYEYIYADIRELKNVLYYPKKLSKVHQPICLVTHLNRFIYLLYMIHHSGRLNKLFNIPFKRIWFNSYFQNSFKDNRDICFIFFGRNVTNDKYEYISYLKKKYPKSKYVCFFQDLIETHTGIDIEKLKSHFDLILSYDPEESEKYDIKYHPTVYSKKAINKNSLLQESDVYFLGSAKDRLAKIYKYYDFFISNNLNCTFYITGVKPKNQRIGKGLNFITNMRYSENLRHLLKTKSILELTQNSSNSSTLRTWESIVYNKKLITNNTGIKYSSFYDPSHIFLLEDTTKEATSNVKKFINNLSNKPNYCYRDEFSPVKLLEFIDKELSN